MALINVTPIMTSTTTPAPYKVTGSSAYDDDVNAPVSGLWVCFDETQNRWLSKRDSVSNQWIMLDFGTETKVSKVTLNSNTFHEIDLKCMPKDLMIQGSNDGSTFITIAQLVSSTWGLGEEKEIDFGRVENYRYYRIFMIAPIGTNTNGNSYMRMGNIRFYYDGALEVIPTREKSSFIYRLPLNTTNSILAKENDPREGLLGMANDLDNYGDLYVVGNDGKSHLTKSGMKDEVIFDGWLGSETTTDISKSIEKYKYLIIEHSVNHKVYGDDVCQVIIMLKLESVRYGAKYQFRIMNYNDSYIDFSFNDATTISIDKIYNNNTGAFSNMAIKKIIGVY